VAGGPSSGLVAIGACGFFGQAASAVGALDWLPPGFEWPAGREYTLTTAQGQHVLLIRSAGRIQVYDSRWRFLRGWPARSALKLRLIDDGTVEALTKGAGGLVFDLEGRLLSQRAYKANEYIDLYNRLPAGEPVNVPTTPWLYMFSSPLLSWLMVATGLVGWFVISRPPVET